MYKELSIQIIKKKMTQMHLLTQVLERATIDQDLV